MKLAAAVLLITNVTVIDTRFGGLRGDLTVVVDGTRIARVENSELVKPPPGAQVVDGTGKFLIPGLWDMHIHTFFGDWVPGGREATLPLFIANGVTGVRDMGSDLEPILAAREDVAKGRLLGPRLIVSGPMLDGPKSQFPSSISITTPEDGRKAVAMLAGRGVDFIKIQSYVPRDAYFAIADECRQRGIVFAGHVPDKIRASEASNAGQKSFEHLIGIFEGSSTAEEAFLEGKKGPARFLETYAPKKEAALAVLLAKNRTWQGPTLFWERGQWLVDTVDVAKDPDARYAPPHWRDKSWPTFKAGILKDLATDPLPVRRKFVEHELGIVKRLQLAAIPFLAGTDTPAGVDVVPGFSLHRELERFVAAGFTPFEALQTATLNPAVFLEKRGDFGTVEKGRIADLVLLDANPLKDIRNARKIRAVVANGRYFSREQLDRILADVAAYAKAR
jgi:imidazolonepropionase-like amidohydrolase